MWSSNIAHVLIFDLPVEPWHPYRALDVLQVNEGAGSSICDVITATAAMIDDVAPRTAAAPLQAEELRLQSVVCEQCDGLAVQHWQKRLVDFALGQLARLVGYAAAGELLGWPFAGIAVAVDGPQSVGFQRFAELLDDDRGLEGCACFSQTSRTAISSSRCAIASVKLSELPPLGSVKAT